MKLKGGTDVGRKRKSAAKPKTVDPVAVNKALKAVEQAFGATTPAEVRHALRRIQGTVGFLRGKCAVFCDTKGVFGGLSNMAGGYAVSVNGITFRTVEALYQACRYPEHSDVQDKIISQNSPLTAKRIARGKQTMAKCRSDWDGIKVEVMRWCLKIKLLQHEEKFGGLLLSTGSLSIVEESAKDNFWGAIPLAENRAVLKGRNVLGELLEDLREQVQQGIALREVEPPLIANFLIMDEKVEVVALSQ